MAISGSFLILFLTQHLCINLTSLIPDNGETFNQISHFMGHNPVVQFILQPILISGVIFHFIMGFWLEIENRQSRLQKYSQVNTNTSWTSKNMILSGLVILAFLILHFYDFWVPEIQEKYFIQSLPDPDKYFLELKHKFENNSARTLIYCFSFILLGLHLDHGFSSAFSSMGIGLKQKNTIKRIARGFSISITVGFSCIALYHYLI